MELTKPPMKHRFRTIAFLVGRYLVSSWLRRRTRAVAAVGVALPIIGVAVGVCAFTVVLSVMGGFVKNLKARLLSMESHIEVVTSNFGQIPEDYSLIEQIREASPRIIGVSPFQRGDAVLRSASRPSTVLLVGVDTVRARQSSEVERFVSSLSLDILEHEMPSTDSDGATFSPIIVGKTLLRHMSAGEGDRLTLVSTVSEEGPAGFAPRQYPVVVAASLNSGNVIFDGKWALASIDFVNEFFDLQGSWAGIQVQVDDPLDVVSVAEVLDGLLLERGLRAKTWMEANSTLVRALALERWGMRFVMFMIILVGCFSITITLVLAVRRKTREMAILRSFGFRRSDLGIVFLVQGATVGLFGVVLGLAVGLGVLFVVQHVNLPWLSSYYSGVPLPVLIDWGDIAMVSVGSFLLATIAAVWPAVDVMRIDVVETLSGRG